MLTIHCTLADTGNKGCPCCSRLPARISISITRANCETVRSHPKCYDETSQSTPFTSSTLSSPNIDGAAQRDAGAYFSQHGRSNTGANDGDEP